MNDLIGKSLGRYHILEQLGEGGMATVYKAYDTRLETDVAVKVIRTENILPSVLERSLKRFEREAKALARLNHPNIVRVTDYGEFEGKPYLVMPYYLGGTLKQKLGKPIAWQEAVQTLLPIAEALDYAHSHNMIHRDVKPSNILLTERGQPMLTDFGIAKILDLEDTQDLTGTSTAIGTPEYMAPEQATAKTVDHRADIYSLGIVLYEMVTGRKPFLADTPMAVLIKHATEPLPRPKQYVPNLPDGVEKVLLKALAKRPEDRYQSMQEFTVPLMGLLGGKQTKEVSISKHKLTEKGTSVVEETKTIGPTLIKTIQSHARIHRRSLGWGFGVVIFGIIAIFSIKLISNNIKSIPAVTASGTPNVAASATPYPLPELPVGVGTPIPIPNKAITAENFDRIVELARWRKGEVKNFAFSSDGKLLAIASNKGVYIYDAISLEEKLFIETEVDVSNVLFTADGQEIVFIQYWGADAIFVYRVSDGMLSRRLDTKILGRDNGDIDEIAFSPAENLLAASATSDDTILIWDLSSGNPIDIIHAPQNSRNRIGISFSPNGKLLAFSYWEYKEINLWDTDNRRLVKTINSSEDGVDIVAFSPNGDLLAAGTSEGIQIWQVSTGNLVRVLDSQSGYSLAFSSDGSKLATSRGKILDVSDGSTVIDLIWAESITYSPDGSTLAGIVGDSLLFWNSTKGSYIGELDGFGNVGDIALSPDGSILASTENHEQGTPAIVMRRISSGEALLTLSGKDLGVDDFFQNMTFSRDGQLFAATDYSRGVLVWDTVSGLLVNKYEEIDGNSIGSVIFLDFDDSGNLIAYLDRNMEIQVWDMTNGRKLYTLMGASDRKTYTVLSPDGLYLATSPTIKLWRLSDGATPRNLVNEERYTDSGIAFSPDSQYLIADVDDGAQIWRVSDGSKAGKFETWGTNTFGFSQDGSFFVTSHGDIWRFSDLVKIRELKINMKQVLFSSDGSIMISIGYDSVIRLWGIPPGN